MSRAVWVSLVATALVMRAPVAAAQDPAPRQLPLAAEPIRAAPPAPCDPPFCVEQPGWSLVLGGFALAIMGGAVAATASGSPAPREQVWGGGLLIGSGGLTALTGLVFLLFERPPNRAPASDSR